MIHQLSGLAPVALTLAVVNLTLVAPPARAIALAAPFADAATWLVTALEEERLR
jgi:hypothetical protein